MSDYAVLAVIDALAELGIGYMLVGSFSTNLYGIPRSTKDADFVVQFQEKSLSDLARRLPSTLKLDPQASFEMVTATTRRILRCDDSAFVIELFSLSSDPHDQVRFERRRTEEMLGRHVYVPTAEDAIITKLRWAQGQRRSRDCDDVANVLGIQRARLDWTYIHHWCDEHGTRKLLDEILLTVPEV